MQKQLRGPALNQEIQEYIKDYIVENQLRAGDALPSEGQIAQNMGVSRSPVREAVKALQSLGIIEAKQGEGLFVREWNLDPVLETLNYGMRVSPTALRELYEIRTWLEISVIDNVVTNITEEELIELDIIMLRLQQAIKAEDAYTHLDKEFHETLLGVSRNETLVKLFNAFWLAFDNYGDEILVSKDYERVIREHKAVLDAIKKRDAQLAREMLAKHFEAFGERVSNLEAK